MVEALWFPLAHLSLVSAFGWATGALRPGFDSQ